jgi:hypothetical protein
MHATSIHQPTFPTIRMVERTIKKRPYIKSRNQLFRKTPKKIMPQTLTTILQYLQESKKVTVNNDSSIVWIFPDSYEIKKPLKKSKSSSRTRSR